MPHSPPRALIISHDRVGSRMAGPGIRAWEIARAVAAHQPTILVAPHPIDMADSAIRTGSFAWGDPGALGPWLAQADVVLANGFVLRAHPELAATALPLALDLYDPVAFESLELFRHAPPAERAARAADDVALLRRQLARGDFFACATEKQRDLYLGALLRAGRIAPALTDDDPQLRHLLDVAPFGLPSAPPTHAAPALRDVVPSIGADDIVLLWAGGLWDWLDPQLLAEAMADVARRNPAVRCVFLNGRHPGMVAEMRAPAETRAIAERHGLLGTQVFFYDDWVPYERRADFLLEADIAVSLHRAHLETAYAAVRSRFLDHLWAGLPSIVSDGDAAADLVRQHGLGAVVPVGDAPALATAILELAGDAERRRAAASNAGALRGAWAWERTLAPIVSFCASPRRTTRPEDAMDEPKAPLEPIPAQDLAARVVSLEALWQVTPQELGSAVPLLGAAKRGATTLTRWYVAPIVAQQNSFNAATVHAIQALAAASDAQREAQRQAEHQIALLRLEIAGLHGQLDGVRQQLADLEQHTCDIDDAQTAMAQQLLDERKIKSTEQVTG